MKMPISVESEGLAAYHGKVLFLLFFLRCKRKTSARKCYSVHRPPNILTLQIKRFSHFGKVGKAVEFPEKLNLRPFMSVKEVQINGISFS